MKILHVLRLKKNEIHVAEKNRQNDICGNCRAYLKERMRLHLKNKNIIDKI